VQLQCGAVCHARGAIAPICRACSLLCCPQVSEIIDAQRLTRTVIHLAHHILLIVAQVGEIIDAAAAADAPAPSPTAPKSGGSGGGPSLKVRACLQIGCVRFYCPGRAWLQPAAALLLSRAVYLECMPAQHLAAPRLPAFHPQLPFTRQLMLTQVAGAATLFCSPCAVHCSPTCRR